MATTHNSPIKDATIPEEFRCNPYDSTPSGNPFFADKRNVEAVSTAFQNDDTVIPKEEFFASLERGEKDYRDGKCVRLRDGETVKQLLERVRG
jgi:hypothetical protein